MSVAEVASQDDAPAQAGARPDNLAEMVDDSDLGRIGNEDIEKYVKDFDSAAPWREQVGKIYDKFYCYLENRGFPWPDAAEAVLPMIAEAAIHMGARLQQTYDSKEPIQALTKGHSRIPLAKRVAKCLTYLYVHEAEAEDAIDLMHTQLPLIGTSFIAQDWDHERQTLDMETLAAEDVVVSYRYRGRLENAARISKIVRIDADDLEDRAEDGWFLPDAADLGPGQSEMLRGGGDELHRKAQRLQGTEQIYHQDGLRTLIQMHTRMSINGQEREPVIVTIDLESRKVLRIASRKTARGQDRCHFTNFNFLRNPTSAVYGIGLGQLMLSLQESGDTKLRQMLNAGTLATASPILYAQRSGLPAGTIYLEPGTLIPVDFQGEKLADEFFHPQFREVSEVDLNVLLLLSQLAQRLSTVTDVMAGNAPRGSNTTAYEVGALLSEGTTVFSNIGKRSLRSRRKMADVSAELVQANLKPEKYSDIIGEDSKEFVTWHEDMTALQAAKAITDAVANGQPGPDGKPVTGQQYEEAQAVSQQLAATKPTPFNAQEDFADVPGPSIQVGGDLTSKAERVQNAQALLNTVLQSPVTQGNPQAVYAVTRNMLEAGDTDDTLIDVIYPEPQAPPPPPDYSPREENARALEGQPNVVLPDQNHREHLGVHEVFLLQDPLGQLLAPEGKDAMTRHMREHAAMLERQGDPHAGPAQGPTAPGGPGPGVPVPQGAGPGAPPGDGGPPLAGLGDDQVPPGSAGAPPPPHIPPTPNVVG